MFTKVLYVQTSVLPRASKAQYFFYEKEAAQSFESYWQDTGLSVNKSKQIITFT